MKLVEAVHSLVTLPPTSPLPKLNLPLNITLTVSLLTVEMQSLCTLVGVTETSRAQTDENAAPEGKQRSTASSAFVISYLGNHGGHCNSPGVSGVRDISLWHCSDVFIMIIMLLLRASLTDWAQVEQPARCNLLYENYHNNTKLWKEAKGGACKWKSNERIPQAQSSCHNIQNNNN